MFLLVLSLSNTISMTSTKNAIDSGINLDFINYFGFIESQSMKSNADLV